MARGMQISSDWKFTHGQGAFVADAIENAGSHYCLLHLKAAGYTTQKPQFKEVVAIMESDDMRSLAHALLTIADETDRRAGRHVLEPVRMPG